MPGYSTKQSIVHFILFKSIVAVMIKISDTQKRFLLVGCMNTLLDYSCFLLLSIAGRSVFIANLVATSIAFAFSFAANRQYTFAHKQGNFFRQFVLFTILTLFALWVIQPVIIVACLQILNNLKLSELLALSIAKVVGIGVTMLWNYLWYAKVVFKK